MKIQNKNNLLDIPQESLVTCRTICTTLFFNTQLDYKYLNPKSFSDTAIHVALKNKRQSKFTKF